MKLSLFGVDRQYGAQELAILLNNFCSESTTPAVVAGGHVL
jgi:hypothetical protein